MATGSPLMHLVTNGRFRCSRGHELVLNRDPSLLCLPSQGRSLLVLPGDGMFQAQRVVNGKCRPVILHGYGGAKKEMPTSLATLAKFGWIPMATAMAMVGSASSPPLRAGNDWRPILGTLVPCQPRKVYSCSVSGFACPVMTCISCMPPTAGCSLAKSISHLVLTVMTLLTLFECCLWISGLPLTLLCSLDPRRPIKATQARQSNRTVGEQKRRLLSNFAFASAKEKGRKPMLLSPAGSDALAEAKLDLDLLVPAVACKRFHCSM